jgi:hypothetical protein
LHGQWVVLQSSSLWNGHVGSWTPGHGNVGLWFVVWIGMRNSFHVLLV